MYYTMYYMYSLFTGMAKLSKINLDWKIEKKKNLIMNEISNNIKDAIFEIKNNTNNGYLELGIRTWKKIKIFSSKNFNSDFDNISFDLKQSVDAYPFTFVSFAFNPCKTEEIVTLNSHHTINLYRNFQNDPIQRLIHENNTHSWGHINYLNNNTIIYVNSFSFKVIDLRTNSFVRTEMRENYSLQNSKITNACFGKKDPNVIYLTNNEKTVQIDIRMSKKNVLVENIWTHTLKESVYLSDNYTNGDENVNIICIANNNPKNRVILSHTKDKINVPVNIPTLYDSLDAAKSYDPTLPSYYLSKRVQLSTTGIKFVENNNELSLFTINSLGDIYINNFQETKCTLDQEIKKCTEEFYARCNDIKKIKGKYDQLNFIDKIIMPDIQNVLNNKPCSSTLDTTRKERDLEKIKNHLKDKILGCKTTLNHVWDIESPIVNIEEIDPSTNVQIWLSKLSETIEKDNQENKNIENIGDKSST